MLLKYGLVLQWKVFLDTPLRLLKIEIRHRDNIVGMSVCVVVGGGGGGRAMCNV